jgi:Zn-dependent membrane protease YugP
LLDELQIVDADGGVAVRKVLNAAALTYVAGTLQTLLTLAYLIFRFTGRRNE